MAPCFDGGFGGFGKIASQFYGSGFVLICRLGFISRNHGTIVRLRLEQIKERGLGCTSPSGALDSAPAHLKAALMHHSNSPQVTLNPSQYRKWTVGRSSPSVRTRSTRAGAAVALEFLPRDTLTLRSVRLPPRRSSRLAQWAPGGARECAFILRPSEVCGCCRAGGAAPTLDSQSGPLSGQALPEGPGAPVQMGSRLLVAAPGVLAVRGSVPGRGKQGHSLPLLG